jgi:O-antigen/teichoic acid export membrane protein
LLIGGLGVVAPELIRIVLTPKWLPMLTPFRLMLVFALLDPIAVGLSGLLVATGRPERVFRPRLAQLAVLVVGLITLGRAFGTNGVALSVDLMVLVGVALLFREARRLVDVSLLTLWAPPLLAMAGGLGAIGLLLSLPQAPTSDWGMLAAKTSAYGSAFMLLTLLVERQRLMQLLSYARAGRAGPRGAAS